MADTECKVANASQDGEVKVKVGSTWAPRTEWISAEMVVATYVSTAVVSIELGSCSGSVFGSTCLRAVLV